MYQHLSMFKEDVLAVHVWCHLMLVIVLNMSSSILPNRMRTPANKQKGQAIAVLVPNIQCLDYTRKSEDFETALLRREMASQEGPIGG
eukprot:m.28868 g.28868  ORF g.28868 m.28868 type:complete len:88 (-) comp11889_c0_seq3:561-824(-)